MRKIIKHIATTAITNLLLTSIVLAKGVELKPYGFIKGDMDYSSNGIYSFGKDNLSAPHLASGVEHSALGFTAQNSRFGLFGSKGNDGCKISGRLELDFYWGGYDTNARSRVRLAYASMAMGNIEIRFGQQWDLFSPINANTINTDGNMWFSGNHGYRRGQIQFFYNMAVGALNPLLQLSIGEGAKEATKLGDDNKATFPMMQGRLSTKFMGKNVIGVYFAYAKFSPNPDSSNLDFSTSGFGVDLNLSLGSKLMLKGEINKGMNLNNANLFCIAGSGSNGDERKNFGVWLNAISKFSGKLHFVAGFGMDKNQTDNLAKGEIEQNTVIYGDLIFQFDHGFSITIELENISTKIKDEGTNQALIFSLSGRLNF